MYTFIKKVILLSNVFHFARNKFGTPVFQPKVFRKQIYCIEESTCNIAGTFRRPTQSFDALRSDSATGELRPDYAPAIDWVRGRTLNHRFFKTLCEDLGSKNIVLLYHTSPPTLTWESLTPLLRTARTNQSLSGPGGTSL